MTTKETMICKNCEEEREKYNGCMPKNQILCASCFNNFVEVHEGENNTMNVKETIEKSDEEFIKEADERMVRWQKYDQALISAYKEELRGEIKKMKVPPKEMQHDLRGRCDFERNLTINKVLDLINKETEI